MRVCLDNLKGRGRGTEWVFVFGLYEGKLERNRMCICV